MDQSRLELGARGAALAPDASAARSAGRHESPRTALRFEPPRLTSIGGGRISRSTVEVGAIAEARAQGRADAMAEMTDAIEQHRRATDDMDAAARALTRALDQLAEADRQRVHDVEQQTLQLALALAEEIIGREVRDDDGLVVTAATRALSLAPDRGSVVLRVNPGDVAAVGDPARLAGHLASVVHVVADPSIDRGGAVAEVGPLRIDAQINSALARIRDAFAP